MEKQKKSLEEQRTRLKGDEEDMTSKKKELSQIQSEESQFQSKLNSLKRDMETLSNSSGQMQLQIAQVKALLVTLEEYESQLKQGTSELEAAITADDYHKLNTLVSRTITPPPELTVRILNVFLSVLIIIIPIISSPCIMRCQASPIEMTMLSFHPLKERRKEMSITDVKSSVTPILSSFVIIYVTITDTFLKSFNSHLMIFLS